MTGLLWYDETRSKPITQIITDATERYRQRFGSAPTVALVNEAAGNVEVEGVRVEGRKDVRRWQVWVG